MKHAKFKEEFSRELLRINANRATIISWIGFFFSIVLLFIDVLRYQSGLFSVHPLYWLMPFSHLLLSSMIIPMWRIKKIKTEAVAHRKRAILRWTDFCLGLTWFSLIPMAVVGIFDRGSIMPYGVYIFIVNLFFVLPYRKRLSLNISSFLLLSLGILLIDLPEIKSFIYLIEALGFIIPTFLISNRQFRLLQDNFESKRLLEEKNASIEAANTDLMMQALQAQMNPHFIFNTLNSIQHFLVSNDQQSSLTYLSRFARLIRLIFQYSKERWIRLEEEIEFLELYLQLEELRFENKITTHFEVDERLRNADDDWVVPPLLIQPLIENAFKHGLMHVEQGGQLKITFREENNCLRCAIEDNGVGREKALAYDQWKIKEHRSSALEIIQQRLDAFNVAIGGQKGEEKVNDLTLIDLQDHLGKPRGTRIELALCLQTQKMLYERSLRGVQTFYQPTDYSS
ncbi:MAG: histidine kinase [Bacteroidota bacterium]